VYTYTYKLESTLVP